jgi:hypothetical protein
MFTSSTARRINKSLLVLLALTSLCLSAIAQQTTRNPQASPGKPAVVPVADGAGTQKLPLRRIVLYKSGVGYFEHAGTVRGNAGVEIDLTSSQLDDVLKSLTALDLNGGRIVGASYNSEEPIGHQFQSLPVPVAAKTTLTSLLEELRGSRLEVRTATAAFTGRLLSVQKETQHKAGTDVSLDQISLLGDRGEVRSFTLEPGTNLRFIDRELEQELSRALGLLDSAHQQDIRHLLLSTTGTGEREVRVSYTSEVPVWKTTYRIVLAGPGNPSGTKPLLQGWAVVDNTVGEDWTDVELSLAAGAPQSFIQKISQPYYTQRVVVPMPRGFLLTPQTHAGTMISTEEATGDSPLNGRVITRGALSAPSAGPGGNGAGVAGALGSGTGGGTGGGAFRPGQAAVNGTADTNDFLAAARSINAAQGSQLGDLFEYKVKDRVTIRKNESAMVPIVQTEITAEKVSLWNAGLGTPRPLRALWFTNTSPLVLDGGSFNVIEGGAFGGEGLIESIQPSEKRLISYAADLGMQVVAKQDGNIPARVTRLRIARGTLIRTTESHQRTIYTLRNEETSPRMLILEHPIRNDWKLAADLAPEEQSATAYRFRIAVPAKQTKTFTVDETRPIVTQYALTNLTLDQIEAFSTARELTPEIENALRQIIAQKDALSKLNADFKSKQADVDHIFQDQERLRENMKALKGTPEEKALAQRYTGELNDQEMRLATLRTEISNLETAQKQAQQDLDATIEKLTFDANL